MVTNKEIIENFIDGATTGHNRNKSLFIEGDILYSYGYYFPLIIRLKDIFLLNKTKYSNTTSKHQSICRNSVDCEEYTTNELQEIIHLTILNNLKDTTMEDINKLKIMEKLEDEI